MSGADTLAYRAKMFVQSLPGRKLSNGGTIPDSVWTAIHDTAAGITQQHWGRWPDPEHIQALFDAGAHDPQAIHDAYGRLPHPHAPGLTIGEYPEYAAAHRVYTEHRGTH